jgi:hypothetical protein
MGGYFSGRRSNNLYVNMEKSTYMPDLRLSEIGLVSKKKKGKKKKVKPQCNYDGVIG